MKDRDRNTIILTGTIVTVCEARTQKNGTVSQQCVMRIDNKYANLVAFTLWDKFSGSLNEGDFVRAYLSTDVKAAHEDPERFHTFLNLWKVQKLTPTTEIYE